MSPPLKQQLPWELVEEILSRLPLQALVRFRTVCKKWNSLFNDKSFLKTHSSRSTPQFILKTDSEVYLIDIIGIDPNSIIDSTTELCVPPPSSGIRYDDIYLKWANITTCDEVFFCNFSVYCENQTALWNPWLRQVTWIDNNDNQFQVVGLGYDNSRPEKVNKMLVWYWDDYHHQRLAMYECASHTLKSIIDTPDYDWRTERARVPFNGNLYWVDYNGKTNDYFIQSFDFSMEKFKSLFVLPCQQNHEWDKLHLAVFEGDRFSVLKTCYETRDIGIWVTKGRGLVYNNGGADDGDGGVVWIKLMNFSETNFPTLFPMFHRPVSYFIYNKTVFICCGGDGGNAGGIYVLKEDLCKKIPIGSGLVNFFHCVYTPNLIPLPSFLYKLD